MLARLEEKIAEYKKDGRLALFANLLYDFTLVGWVAFAGLYTIEALLPTFVAARLSLVKLAVVLLLLTSLLAWLGKTLDLAAERSADGQKLPHFYLLSLMAIGIGIVALAHYRFPWWSIPVALTGYALAAWLFLKSVREQR